MVRLSFQMPYTYLLTFTGNLVGLTDHQHSRAQHRCDHRSPLEATAGQIQNEVSSVMFVSMIPTGTRQGDL